MTNLAGLRWLLPAGLFRAAGLAEHVQDAATRCTYPVTPDWPVLDGPESRALDAWLRPRLPDGFVCCRREDYGTRPDTAATVLYRGRRGGYVRVLRRRLSRPLLLDALCDPRRDGCVQISATGTDIVRRNDDTADVHRLVLVRPIGTMLIIEAVGLPTVGAAAPLSGGQLDELAHTLDSPDTDIEVELPTEGVKVG